MRLAPAWIAWPAAVILTILGVRRHLALPYEDVAVFVRYYGPAILLAAFGCLPSFLRGLRERTSGPPRFVSRPALAVATLLVLGTAVGLRLTGLGLWPPPTGSGFEEAQLGQQAHRLLVDGDVPREHLLAILAPAAAFRFLGASLFTLRLPFMVVGALLPLLVYLACRRRAAPEVALFATALLGVSWWSLASARIADEIFFPAFLLPLVLWSLDHFMESGRTSSALALGLSVGLLTYEYTGYHVVPALLAAFLLARGALALRGGALLPAARRFGPGLFVAALVWTDLALPRFVGDAARGEHYFFEGFVRHQQSGCSLSEVGLARLPAYAADRLGELARIAFVPAGGAEIPYLGEAGHALFDPAAGLVLAVSAVLVALTPRRRHHLLVLAWILGSILVSALFPCSLNPHRLYTILPLFFVVVALGMQVLWERLQTPGARRILLAAFAGLTMASAAGNLGYFWNGLLHGEATRAAFASPPTRVSLWLSHLPADAVAWLVADEYEYLGQPNDYYWLMAGRRVETVESLPAVLPSPELPAGPLYYLSIARAPQPGLERVLRAFHPGARALDATPIAIPDTEVQLFRIDPGPARAAQHAPDPALAFRATYASSRREAPPAGPELPEDAEVLLERAEWLVSELSIPLPFKKKLRDQAESGARLWCAWEGEIESLGQSSAAFRLYVHDGDAWLRIGSDPGLSAAAPQGQSTSTASTARLRPGRTPFRLVYRLGPRAFIGPQVYRTLPDGTEQVLTAPLPAAGPRP